MRGSGDGDWLLYGANGYTGTLIADEAIRQGLRPILAGRRADALAPLAARLGLPTRVFPLDDPGAIAAGLAGTRAVLHAAGPFSRTSAPMVEACLRTGVHYLDVTGEIAVFEAIFARDADARAAGCALVPGVGFDVVPTDCVALALAQALPSATRLELAWAAESRPSRGTARTALEGIGAGGAIREAGVVRRVPAAWRRIVVPFRDRARTCVSIPWGDVSTAYHTTGIPDVVVYGALSPGVARLLRLARPLLPLVAAPPVRRFLERRIDRTVRGPDEEARRSGRAQVWGRATAPDGRAVTATLVTPDVYALTAVAAVAAMQRVLEGQVGPGALTPARAFGSDFIEQLPGCDLRVERPSGATRAP